LAAFASIGCRVVEPPPTVTPWPRPRPTISGRAADVSADAQAALISRERSAGVVRAVLTSPARAGFPKDSKPLWFSPRACAYPGMRNPSRIILGSGLVAFGFCVVWLLV